MAQAQAQVTQVYDERTDTLTLTVVGVRASTGTVSSTGKTRVLAYGGERWALGDGRMARASVLVHTPMAGQEPTPKGGRK